MWHSAVEALRASGHTVRVLTTDHERAGRRDTGDADIWRDLRWYWRDHGFPRRTLRQALAIERHNLAVVSRHLDEFSPDVVSWWPMGGMSLGPMELVRRRGVPAVAFVHDDWLLYGPIVDGWHARWRGRPRAASMAERVFGVPASIDFARAAHYAFVSECTRTRARRDHPELGETSIVHSGVGAAFLEPAAPCPWRWRLLYVGRIDARKGVATAVQSLAALPPDAELEVVGAGGGDAVAVVRATAVAAGVEDRVAFLGERTQDELPGLYAEADVVVFPVEWAEPWGLVPLEAMGRGRPVVATGRGGSAEYLRDGENALLFDAGDAAALAVCVRRLAEDADLRRRLREGGSKTAREHPATRFNEAVEATLARTAAG